MTDIAGELGVQSYCFRGFKDNGQVAEKVKQCGLSRIELCGVHADFSDEKRFDEVINVFRNAGVDIVGIGVQGFSNDEAAETLFFEFARRAGAKVISADFTVDSIPGSFRTAEKLADRFDINVAIHNHGGRHWLGSAAMLRNVFANTTERIGLCLDTAWALDSNENPLEMAEIFGNRLYGVHIKDFLFDRARKPQDVVAGQGNLDLGKFIATLRKVGFNGACVLEYEGDVDDPVPALTRCAAAVREAG